MELLRSVTPGWRGGIPGGGCRLGHQTAERPRAGRNDVDIHQSAHHTERGIEDHDPVAARASGELGAAVGRRRRAGGFPLLVTDRQPLDEHLLPGADEWLVARPADLRLGVEEDTVAFLLHPLRHVVGLTLKRLRARSRTVFEDEAVLETRLTDEVERGLELGVGLAAEADDEIARHRRMRQRGADHREHLAVFADRVPTPHPGQHRIRPVLRRHVEVGTDLGKITDGGDEIGGHVARVVGHEADAVETVDGIESTEEVGEAARAAAVGPRIAVDGLADERDLPAALGDQPPGLGEDGVGRSGLLRPADVRHHAEAAELVAAGLGAEEGLEGIRPHRRITVGIVALEAPRDLRPAAGGAPQGHFDLRSAPGTDRLHQQWHTMELAGADDEIDPRRPRAHERLVLLRHAAENTDHEPRTPLLLQTDPAERRVDLVFGMLPDTAGVVEHRVGLGRGAGEIPPLATQGRNHELAVEHVHLAADGFDPEAGHGAILSGSG